MLSNISQCIVRMKHFKYIKVFVVVDSMGDVRYYLATLGEGRTHLLSPLALFVDVAYLVFTRDYAFLVWLSRSYFQKIKKYMYTVTQWSVGHGFQCQFSIYCASKSGIKHIIIIFKYYVTLFIENFQIHI